MIQLENVSKVYGKGETEFVALDDVSLEVPSGSIVAIVGKSGSGKSTLMHIMSGLDATTKGKVLVDDQDLSKMKGHKVDRFRADSIGFIFQSFFIEPKQTCFQNVALPLEIRGKARSSRKKMVEAALENVGLTDKSNVPAGNLSGGQKQRLAIARAIVNKPTYIFADEPTGNLDSSNGEKIMKLLFSLNEYMGSTLVIVTHDIEISKKCQIQISLKDGKIESTKEQKPKSKKAKK